MARTDDQRYGFFSLRPGVVPQHVPQLPEKVFVSKEVIEPTRPHRPVCVNVRRLARTQISPYCGSDRSHGKGSNLPVRERQFPRLQFFVSQRHTSEPEIEIEAFVS